MADRFDVAIEDRASPWLAAMPGALRVELLSVADVLSGELVARARDAAGGGILGVGTGALLASIAGDVSATPGGFVASASADAPQAGILEYGGTIAAHDILPDVARVLRFAGGAGAVYAAAVHHPSVTIAGRSYLGGPLAAMAPEIVAAQAAALDAVLAR